MSKGYVYFAGYGDKVKIGKSNKPERRLVSFNNGNPNQVRLFISVESYNMGDLERRMHKHFLYCRVPKKREWYNLSHELKFLIMSLVQLNAPTDLGLGMILGEYKAIQNPVADNPSLHRHTKSLELSQRELWALSYAVRSLGMHDYPAFQERYAEAKQLVAPLLDDEVPMFIQEGNKPLAVAIATIETGVIPLSNLHDDENPIAV